jgi:hypothetical protein
LLVVEHLLLESSVGFEGVEKPQARSAPGRYLKGQAGSCLRGRVAVALGVQIDGDEYAMEHRNRRPSVITLKVAL